MGIQTINNRFPLTCEYVSKAFLTHGGSQRGANFMLEGMTVLRHPSFMRNIEAQLMEKRHGDEIHQLDKLIKDVFHAHEGITL